ncbi:MAG: ATPase domain-containing protein [Candidatus Margulisiibacteriota bacterium]|jgi:circadian clock protein KaiC
MEKVTTGIEGLDALLGGGLPRGRAYLISGEPGTGKTTFCLQFLLEGVKQNENTLYIGLDERPEHLIEDALSIGWDITPHLKAERLRIVDITSYFATHPTQEEPTDPMQIVDDIVRMVHQGQVTRLVIDPIAPLTGHYSDRAAVAQYVRKLIFSLESEKACTSLLTSYMPVGAAGFSPDGIVEFSASGIIVLRLVKHHAKYMRSIWLRKIRSAANDLTEYSFDMLPTRGIVLRQPL